MFYGGIVLKVTKADKFLIKVPFRVLCVALVCFVGYDVFQMLQTGQFTTKSGSVITELSNPLHFNFYLAFKASIIVASIYCFVKVPFEFPKE